MKKALITGITGMVGSQLVDYFYLIILENIGPVDGEAH